MPRKNTVILELKGTTTAAGLLTLRSNPLQIGQTLCLQWVALRSPLTDGAIAHLWAERNGIPCGILTLTLTSHAMIYYSPLLVWLPSEYGVIVDVTGGGNLAEFHAWLYGYLAALPE